MFQNTHHVFIYFIIMKEETFISWNTYLTKGDFNQKYLMQTPVRQNDR